MRRFLFASVAAIGLAACSTTTPAPVSASTVSTVLADTQLFCSVGPAVAAMASSEGASVAPIIAKAAASSYVQGVCAAVGGLAVSPPADASGAPVLVVPSFKLPLKA